MAPKTPRLLKVHVDLTVTIDVDDYCLNYGIDDPATIRSDVRDAVADACRQGAVIHDGIVDVDVKR